MTPIKELREALALTFARDSWMVTKGVQEARDALSSALDELEHARISVMALAGHRRVIDTLEADNTALRAELAEAMEANQRTQVTSEYEEGHRHGMAVAVSMKTDRDAARTALAVCEKDRDAFREELRRERTGGNLERINALAAERVKVEREIADWLRELVVSPSDQGLLDELVSKLDRKHHRTPEKEGSK